MKAEDKELNMFKVWLAIALGFGLALHLIEQPFLANVAFLTAGVLLAIVIDLVRESVRRPRQARDLARALYEELANRIARCVFDFEAPWERWTDRKNCTPTDVDIVRLRKFIPISPTIYPATAAQIALLEGNAPQAIVRFYVSLAIYQKDMEDVADHCQRNNLPYVPPKLVALLAERLRRTLAPGLEALSELSKMVEGYERIDAEAIREADSLFKHFSMLKLESRLRGNDTCTGYWSRLCFTLDSRLRGNDSHEAFTVGFKPAPPNSSACSRGLFGSIIRS